MGSSHQTGSSEQTEMSHKGNDCRMLIDRILGRALTRLSFFLTVLLMALVFLSSFARAGIGTSGTDTQETFTGGTREEAIFGMSQEVIQGYSGQSFASALQNELNFFSNSINGSEVKELASAMAMAVRNLPANSELYTAIISASSGAGYFTSDGQLLSASLFGGSNIPRDTRSDFYQSYFYQSSVVDNWYTVDVNGRNNYNHTDYAYTGSTLSTSTSESSQRTKQAVEKGGQAVMTGQKTEKSSTRSRTAGGFEVSTREYEEHFQVNYKLLGYDRIQTDVTHTTTTTQTDHYDAYQYVVTYVSPLVLDMDGDGKIQASGGQWLPHPGKLDDEHLVSFDFYGNGFPVVMEWVGPQDGLLCVVDGEGVPSVSGLSLFGTAGGYSNGFEKLLTFDTNRNGRISGEELAPLCVWQDLNQNGRADPGELRKVTELGISQINLSFRDFTGSFVMEGKTRLMWDWWPNIAEVKKVKVMIER